MDTMRLFTSGGKNPAEQEITHLFNWMAHKLDPMLPESDEKETALQFLLLARDNAIKSVAHI